MMADTFCSSSPSGVHVDYYSHRAASGYSFVCSSSWHGVWEAYASTRVVARSAFEIVLVVLAFSLPSVCITRYRPMIMDKVHFDVFCVMIVMFEWSYGRGKYVLLM
jgi:hypothetical protein